MGFHKGIRYPHPPRGPARKPYTVSEKARRQRIRNLSRTRLRSDRESRIIKLLVWQSCFGDGQRPSQRTLARQLRIWPSYLCKVRKRATDLGWDALVKFGSPVTLDDLADARRFTAKVREQEPGLLAPIRGPRLYEGEARGAQQRPMTADEIIAEQRRFAEEWKRENPGYGNGRRVLFSVPVR